MLLFFSGQHLGEPYNPLVDRQRLVLLGILLAEYLVVTLLVAEQLYGLHHGAVGYKVMLHNACVVVVTQDNVAID